MQLGNRRRGAVSLPSIGGKWDPKLLATDVPFSTPAASSVEVMTGRWARSS